MTDIEVTTQISILEPDEERLGESKDYYFQVDFLLSQIKVKLSNLLL